MDRAETLKIMAVLRAAYPQYYGRQSREELDAAVGLWRRIFEAESYELMSAAVLAHIAGDASGFPPPPGKIKAAVWAIANPGAMTELEAWMLVKKALRNSAYEAMKEYRGLPADIQAVLGSPATLREWCVIDDDRVNTVIASNFQRSYRERAAAARGRDALPESVKRWIGGASPPQLEG